ncbi:helix-turn-helix domain-containing protein [Deinococcus cellulosilyticus]|uniref:HTH araC/xylS-type domain-containing protein n=1 Tax=Deinococcus cellulosilyticus (strain DSM 18568 / NBRC 106333 / KACC 11606 / 5516J-15) TaxID=1223518 RepID=A0A511N8F4_DEIC1|nr:AraC family transcriptional regulator [Deinococcus cellulosilyticus]GEM49115.1 hypothetical protein DC3_47500 [Deinococcus cellulosilyticus NBRC 106333 = KACC 11606]
MDKPKVASDIAQNAASAKHEAFGAPLTFIGTYRVREGAPFPAHHHSGHEVIVWHTGQVELGWQQHGETHHLLTHPGMVTVMPGGTTHWDTPRKGYSHHFALFEGNFACPGFEQARHFLDDSTGSMERLLLALNAEFNNHQPERNEMLTLLLKQFEVCLLRLDSRQTLSAAEALVQRAKHLIEERCTENPSVQSIARELGTSVSHLRAQFAVHSQGSPKAHLQKVRVKRAIQHLKTSSLSLEALASLLGYASAGHLSREVKQLTGFTPGQIRRQR